MKLRGKLIIGVASLLLALSLVMIVFFSNAMIKQARAAAEKSAVDIARGYAEKVTKDLGDGFTVARTLAASFEGIISSKGDRAIIRPLATAAIKKADGAFGIAIAFEPNAFDGKDAQYAGADLSDKEGRLIPYFFYDKDHNVKEELLDMSPGAGAGDWYDIPVKENREKLLSPYVYPVDGRQVLMTTATVPVHHDGKPVGIVTEDRDLAVIHEYAKQLKPFDAGKVEILADNGMWVATSDTTLLGKPTELDVAKRAVAASAERKTITEFVNTSEGKMLYVSVPITFGQAKETWTVLLSVPESALLADAYKNRREAILITMGICLLALGGMWWFAGNFIRPIGKITQTVNRLADGDMQAEVPVVNSRDEISEISKALTFFKEKLVEVERLRLERAESDRIAQQERRKGMLSLADDFEKRVGNVVNAVTQAAHGLDSEAQQLTRSAADGIVRVRSVVESSRDASNNLVAVAGASEELSSSINEIAQQISRAESAARSAVAQAGETNQKVHSLSEAAKRINDVVVMISSISSQTNLLALNATIEAARAGEAGRGFTVVAQEVKQLAAQTAKATEEIAQQITTIQEEIQGSVGAIAEIVKTIDSLNEVTVTIAAAVEEQGAATSEISQNVQRASGTVKVISDDTTVVSEAVEHTGHSSSLVQSAVSSLNEQAAVLKSQVEAFIKQVREA